MKKPTWIAVAGASAVMIAAGWKAGTTPVFDPLTAGDAYGAIPVPEPTTTSATPAPEPAVSASAEAAPAPAPAGPSGTFTGNAVRTSYGTMQVAIVVSDGVIVDVKPLIIGLSDSESRRINAYAVPILEQRVLAAQSASVSYVSGASYTSQGYLASVASAVSQAGI